MFGVVPKSIWNKAYPSDDNNLINLAMRCLLLIDDNRKILIDTGIGDKQEEKFFNHYHLNGNYNLLNSLHEAGFHPDEITDVLLTHLHFDHCGGTLKWNSDRTSAEPVFKNAVHHISRLQWEWATHPNRREKASFLPENILPIAQTTQLNLFDEGFTLGPALRVQLVHGHTDGQAIPIINTGRHTVVFMADTVPTATHIPLPYIMGYDTRPLLSLTEKDDLLREAADNNYILFFEHDVFHECGLPEHTDKGIRLKQTLSLAEALAL